MNNFAAVSKSFSFLAPTLLSRHPTIPYHVRGIAARRRNYYPRQDSYLSRDMIHYELETTAPPNSSCYWGKHTRSGMTEDVRTLALRLLDVFDQRISAQLTILHYYEERNWVYYRPGQRGPAGFTGLHAVAFLGIVEIVAAVLEMKEWDVNATDILGNTALTWVARRGHEGVVKMLLERGDVNPDRVDTEYGRTQLSWAAGCGREGVVKMLLEQGNVNTNHVDTFYGLMPLSLAALGGREGVVKMLLEQGNVNTNHVDTDYGQTPLSLAAQCVHEGVVEMLLERVDANPDCADTRYGRTPLEWAAENKHDRVVESLSKQKGVRTTTPDSEN